VGGGSDGTTASAWAIKEACKACKQLVLEAALETRGPNPFPPGTKPEDLDTADSKVFLKADPSKSMAFSQLQNPYDDTRQAIGATYNGRPPRAVWTSMGKKLDTMNMQICEVAVDTETGEVEVLKHYVAADPGKIMRRTSLASARWAATTFPDPIFSRSTCRFRGSFRSAKDTGSRFVLTPSTFPTVSAPASRLPACWPAAQA